MSEQKVQLALSVDHALEYPEIRRACQMMVWRISRELVQLKGTGGYLMVMPDVGPYLESLQALAGTVADDWGGLEGLNSVIAEIIWARPLCFSDEPNTDARRWRDFVAEIIALGVSAGLCRKDLSELQDSYLNLQKASLFRLVEPAELKRESDASKTHKQWFMFGIENNWILPGKWFFSKKRLGLDPFEESGND